MKNQIILLLANLSLSVGFWTLILLGLAYCDGAL